jgi:hypothetical protein
MEEELDTLCGTKTSASPKTLKVVKNTVPCGILSVLMDSMPSGAVYAPQNARMV